MPTYGKLTAKLVLSKTADAAQGNYHCQAFENHAKIIVGTGSPQRPVPEHFVLVLVQIHPKDPAPYALAVRQNPGKRVIAFSIGEETTSKGMEGKEFIAGKTIFEVADKLAKLFPPEPSADDDMD